VTRYLLDRNVLTELEDPHGDKRVHALADTVNDTDLFLCTITIYEAQKGFARRRRKKLTEQQAADLASDEEAFHEIRKAYAGRILPVAEAEALAWAELVGAKENNVMDRALVAVARVNGLVLVTRNLKDMRGLGVRLLDPFAKSPMIEEPAPATGA
jgi:predicted nucleic acid-binding protein